LEQQAPQVGVHTQPSGDPVPQVPSSVMTPVCHGGTAALVALWAAVPETRSAKMALIWCIVSAELDRSNV
jgi:hypothetical protein